MNSIDPFRHDDAAYVLGALSAAERAAFEAHLIECDDCTARVREVAGVPAVLAGLTSDDLAGLDSNVLADDLPDTLLPALARAARGERRRQRLLLATGGAVAAAAIVALAVVAAAPTTHHTGTPQAMSPIGSSPVRATALVTDTAWGTSITLDCRYDTSYSPADSYELLVVDRAGGVHQAGSWTLAPGAVTHFTGGIALPRAQIAEVEIARPDNEPILTLSL